MAAIAAVGLLARPSQAWLAIVVVVAMFCGLLPQAIDAFFGGRHSPLSPPPDTGSVTLAIHVKDEPTEICRAGIVAAAASAPTVVITTDAETIELLGVMSVPVVVGRTIEEAMNRAAQLIETDAVLIMSARSFANVPAAEVAAGLIARGSSWVTGGCETFNDDGFAPMVREQLRRRLRSSARSAGVELWEPNATIISTKLIRDRPFVVGRPWGSSMRSWVEGGSRGVECDLTFAMSAEPTNVRSYWPTSIQRRRGAVADVADAFLTGRGRKRWLAFGLLLRELIGYPLTLALLSPWLLTTTTEFPFRCPLWTVLILWLPATMVAWYAERKAYGLRPRPLEDALALAFDAPASILALPAVFSRRVSPTRLPIPGRPLMVAAFAFATITLVPLLTRGTTTERAPAVGLALTELALLWLLAMRAVFQRNWAHRTYRILCRLPVKVDGVQAMTFDVSPSGLSYESTDHECALIGSQASLDIELDDGTAITTRCTLVDRRPRGHHDVTGVRLHVDPADEGRWISQPARAALNTAGGRTSSVQPRDEPVRWVARVLTACTIAVSTVIVATLCMTTVGYRPLIIRSGSMKPALNVGDVVFVEEAEAAQLGVGDIATIDVGDDETLTHRVRAVARSGPTVIITTRGDANPKDETFTLSEHDMVGRVVGRIPRIGSTIAWAGTATARRGAAAGVIAYLAGALVVCARRRRAESHLEKTSPDGATGRRAGREATGGLGT